MANFTTIFFPHDQSFVPSSERIAQGIAFLDKVYHGHYAVEPHIHASPQFIDAGAAFDRLQRPSCGTTITPRDFSDWWHTGPLVTVRTEETALEVPCCNKTFRIRQLDVGELTGFASFHLNVDGAGEDVGPDAGQMEQLVSILDCPVRQLISVMD